MEFLDTVYTNKKNAMITISKKEKVCFQAFFFWNKQLYAEKYCLSGIGRRKKGIGKELLQYVVQFVKASNISKIWVMPTPFAEQENDCKLPLEFVYTIYEHLGFQFENPSADRKKEGNIMYLSVK